MAADGPLLVEVDELRDYMSGIELAGYQQAAAEQVIRGVTAEIEAYLGRPILVKERIEKVVARRGGGWLSATPVLSIADIDGSVYADWDPYLSAIPDGRLHGARYGTNVVRYTGGLAADENALALLRAEILRAAAVEMTNKHDDTMSLRGLDIRESNDDEKPKGTPHGVQTQQFERLKRYKRRGVR